VTIDDPFWVEEIERARRQSPEEKLRLGGDLFDMACEVALSGIRAQHPGITDQSALAILRQRLDLARRMEGIL
jgi:hypothetical protein